MTARPAPLYKRLTMAQRVLDRARYTLRQRGDDPCNGGELIAELLSAAEDLDASKIEATTACAYLYFAVQDEREAQRDPAWPHTRHQARRAASVALAYAETHEPGCIVNVRA